MGLLDKLSQITDSLFELPDTPPVEEQPQIPDEPLLLLEQAESSAINGDINSAAQQLLEEELAQVTSADDENTIFKVKVCLPFLEEFDPPEKVCSMIQTVAGKDPAVLAEDGKRRIDTIEKVIKDTSSQAIDILLKASKKAEEIKEERIALSSSYEDSCADARRRYEEKVTELKNKLEEELNALKEQNDIDTADLEERGRKNAQMREDAQSLSRAVETLGRSKIEEISKLLARITPSDKSEPN